VTSSFQPPPSTAGSYPTGFRGYVLVLVQINLRLEERPGRANPKPRVAITPASPYAFTVTFMQVVTLSCPQPVHMLWHATTKPTDPNFGG
jgi:hypothetical protein